MKNKIKLWIIVLLLLIPIAFSIDGPSLSITEQATAYYNLDGSLSTSISKNGHVDVFVSNDQDVLHDIDVTLIKTNKTNLLSDIAYRSTASSPFNDSTRLFVSTSLGQSTKYSLDNSVSVPMVYFSAIDYYNHIGGVDISQDRINNFTFSFSFYGSQTLNGATLRINIKKDTFNLSDCMDIYAVSASSGSIASVDSDGDGDHDTISWSGSIYTTPTTIQFDAAIDPSKNFNQTQRINNPNPESGYSIGIAYDQNTIFSDVEVSNRYSRAPVRQGLEWFHTDNWHLRGFMMNPSYGLSYDLSNFDLYDKNNIVVKTQSIPNFTLVPNASFYADVYYNATKSDYFSPSFDWEVIWDNSPTTEQGHFNGYRKLPELKQMYVGLNKQISEVSASGSNRVSRVSDTIRHTGHPDLDVKSVNHVSYINPPWNIENGSIQIYYKNDAGQLTEITNQCAYSFKQPESPGFVLFSYDILGNLGHPLSVNEDIILRYNVYTNSSQYDIPYQFSGEAEMTTLSGTPSSAPIEAKIEYSEPTRPVYEYASFLNEFSTPWVDATSAANVHISEMILDPSYRGVGKIQISILIPKDSLLDYVEVDDAKIDTTYKGTVFKNDIEYDEYVVSLSETYHDGETIDLKYRANIPAGTHNLITIFRGLDIKNGLYISDQITETLVIKGILEFPLDIYSEYVQGPAYVNELVKWYQTVTISNYNSVEVNQQTLVEILPDTVQAYMLDPSAVCCSPKEQLEIITRAGKSYVKLPVSLSPSERHQFTLLLFTPPVNEINREIIPIESNEDYAIFLINSTLENSAMESYVDIRDLYDLELDKVIEVSDNIEYMGYGNQLLINTSFLSKQRKNVWIKYRESLPMMYINLNKQVYVCNDLINITTLFVAPEDQDLTHVEYEIIGPDYFPVNLYADAFLYTKVQANEVIQENINFPCDDLPSGKYEIFARYRKGFFTILSKQKEFSIVCRKDISKVFIYFLLIIIAAILFARIYEGVNDKVKQKYYRKIRKFIKYLKKKYDKF